MNPTKWNWMMDYCRRKSIPPAEDWAWKEAAKAVKTCKNL